MSRLATELTRIKPISFTDQLPLIFRGKSQIPNIGLNSVGKPGVDDRQATLIKNMYAQSDLASSVSEGFRIRDDVYRSISEEMTAANRGAVSPRGFELSARRIGRLMREQFNLGFVDVGGWIPMSIRAAPPVISPIASASSAARWRVFPRRSDRRDGATRWWS